MQSRFPATLATRALAIGLRRLLTGRRIPFSGDRQRTGGAETAPELFSLPFIALRIGTVWQRYSGSPKPLLDGLPRDSVVNVRTRCSGPCPAMAVSAAGNGSSIRRACLRARSHAWPTAPIPTTPIRRKRRGWLPVSVTCASRPSSASTGQRTFGHVTFPMSSTSWLSSPRCLRYSVYDSDKQSRPWLLLPQFGYSVCECSVYVITKIVRLSEMIAATPTPHPLHPPGLRALRPRTGRVD